MEPIPVFDPNYEPPETLWETIKEYFKHYNDNTTVRLESTATYKRIASDIAFDDFNMSYKLFIEADGVVDSFRPLGYLRSAYKRYLINIGDKKYKITPELNERVLDQLEEDFYTFKNNKK